LAEWNSRFLRANSQIGKKCFFFCFLFLVAVGLGSLDHIRSFKILGKLFPWKTATLGIDCADLCCQQNINITEEFSEVDGTR